MNAASASISALGHKVISADFRHDDARWHVEMELADGSRTRMTANFIYLGSGYYGTMTSPMTPASISAPLKAR